MRENVSVKILVVDDEQEVRRNIEQMLLRAGYDVTAAANGIEALRFLESQTFQLALLDVMMPDWTGNLSKNAGLDLLKEIRQQGWDIPVVMLTASRSVGTAVEAMKYGASEYLEKGAISGREFVQKIEETLNKNPSLLQNTIRPSPTNLSPNSKNFSMWKQWLIERSSGLIDEVLGAAVIAFALYVFGNIAGIFEGNVQTILTYSIISLLIIVALLIAYIWWQRKRRQK